MTPRRPRRSGWYATRTIRALELATQQPVSAADVADDLLIDVRTARRLLHRLADEGMLVREVHPRLRFLIGPRLAELAHRVAAASQQQ
jgi:DNA-binding IclR family transcriptional regulator